MRASDRHGFTLIELSIVLVIIGLLVGGILVGRELIRAAELRADISAVDKFDAAVNTFRLKYNCLPGDCPNATQFLSGAYNGNGNGVIEPEMDADPLWGWYIGYEIAFAIDDLARANLIAISPFDAGDSGITTDMSNAMPRLPSGSAFVAVGEFHWIGASEWVWEGKHAYRLGVSNSPVIPGTVKTLPAHYTPHDGYFIDSKIDDGKGATGRVTGAFNYGWDLDIFSSLSGSSFGVSCPVAAAGVESYGLTEDTCDYDLTLKDKLVGLWIRASF